MGRIARVLQTIGNRVNMDLGGFFTNECDRVQPSGDDSMPMPNDDGYAEQWGTSGRWVSLGYFDYSNKVAQPGEKRIYARDSGGTAVSHVYLMNTGEIEIKNDSASCTLKPDGTIEIKNNGASYTLNSDGTTIETNGTGTKTMLPDGTVNINGFIIGPDGSAISPVSIGAPMIISATMTAGGSGVSMSGPLEINGEDYDAHTHSSGALIDAEGRPVSGTTGSKS